MQIQDHHQISKLLHRGVASCAEDNARNSLWPLSGASPGQGPIRRSGEFSNVRCRAFYFAIDGRDVSTALVYTWRRKLRGAHSEPEPDELAATGFAAAVMIEDADVAPSGLQPAIVIDLARGKRISIFASASPALVASALCETITQPPAPFHVVPRGWAGPSFLAMLLFEKYGQHQPLNRQAERFAREGVPLSTSTLADQVGAAAFALMPLYRLIEAHVLAAERLHGDDTTVPVMAKVKTDTARLWVYVRDDRPFAGADPPAVRFHYSRDRRGEHPRAHLASWSGILQADAYGGYGELYAPGRMPAPVLKAGCFAHARRKFFELADVASAGRKKSRGDHAGMIYPIAPEAVQRIDTLFDVERRINGKDAAERLAVRQELSVPLMAELPAWLTAQLARLSRNHDLAKAINYMLRRWDAFTRFFDDGRICLTNNAAERALRCVPLGRKAWLFCGSDRGGQRAATLYTLIQTARLNDVDPQAWLADVLARIAEHPARQLDQLMPWNWQPAQRPIAT